MSSSVDSTALPSPSSSTLSPRQRELLERWGEIRDLDAATAVLQWDQETQMPPQGVEPRARVLATLAGQRHRQLTDPRLVDLVEACADELNTGELAAQELEQGEAAAAARVREARKLIQRTAAVPETLARELAEVEARGMVAWEQAREQGDFELWRPLLEHMVALKHDQARCWLDCTEGADGPYDTLLESFEPGARERTLAPLFEQLTDELVPLVRAVAESGVEVDESPARGDFPEAAQRALGFEVAKAIGFDFQRGRLDLSTHPFCVGFSPSDVRLTWRFEEQDWRPGLYGILHEAGHGLYEQGLPEEESASPLGVAVSLGIHESQSRLWENLVGRSRPFLRWLLGPLRRHLDLGDGVSVETLWPALHTVKPTLIRVEADEGTYNLHVAARFDLERRLFRGEISVGELPELWDETYERLLGIRAENPADGVLQDVHWSMGAFGYFPTYTLGTLAASQLYAAAESELGDLPAALERGECAELLAWLRRHIHRWGSQYSADQLLQEATGAELSPQPFLQDLRANARAVYGVSV
ncbi:MAG: carboxypeptidase M32 [Acidobacteriota bacterium]